MLDSDKKVLSYNDVLLRRADVELLTGPRWLNDQVISFYFEYITQERLQGGHQSVVFVPPSISFLLANCGEDGSACVVMESLQVRSQRHLWLQNETV